MDAKEIMVPPMYGKVVDELKISNRIFDCHKRFPVSWKWAFFDKRLV